MRLGSNKAEQSMEPLMNLAVLVFVALAGVTYFSNSISVSTFGTIAFVTTAAFLVLTYFGRVVVRTSLLFTAVAGILLLGVMFSDASQSAVKSDRYQAVFFTNGQVYFGHLKDAKAKNPVLEDVYTLQTTSTEDTTVSQPATAPEALAVAKLETAAHAPENEMILKSDQILFWENLNESSKVVQLIKAAQKEK